ncbi:MAG: quinohemoprotein amine dehydrogenase subunit alpha, partial [Caenispirillum sp.]|nr:quinohemoprotein amine dehydrogenase subunit alpha [Caenispirillum sp.]
QPGTADDVRLGALPAAWAVANRDAAAEAMEDAKFALTSHGGGLFQPALAGPNPQRRFGTNNVGDLAVTAAVKDGGKTVSGEGRLVVTVQRWNDPPIH